MIIIIHDDYNYLIPFQLWTWSDFSMSDSCPPEVMLRQRLKYALTYREAGGRRLTEHRRLDVREDRGPQGRNVENHRKTIGKWWFYMVFMGKP